MSAHAQTTDLSTPLEALAQATDLAAGRLPAEVLGDARAVVARAGERAGLSATHTVVALAGATGSGKSSLYNALTGLELSAVGVRRPTTAEAHACLWGPEGATELLDWLKVPPRQRRTHDSELDLHPDDDLAGLVLLDLPDHDSTSAEHRAEVDRLTAQVDLVVWVTDPQKYADAAFHDRYLRPLGEAGVVTVVVLNQVDRLTGDEAGACLEDLHRLVAEDGLGDAAVVATSAVDGRGVAELRSIVAGHVAGHRAAAARLRADLDGCAQRLADEMDRADPAPPAGGEPLVDVLSRVAGVGAVADLVHDVRLDEGWRATAWPPARWRAAREARRTRRPTAPGRADSDRPGDGASDGSAEAPAPASPVDPPPVPRAAVDDAVRAARDEGSAGLPARWADVAAERVSSGAEVARALDAAFSEVTLARVARPLSWRLAGLAQLLVTMAAAVGLAGLAAAGVLALAGVALPLPGGPLLPALLAVGGGVLGVLVALAADPAVRREALRRRAVAAEELRTAVAEVARRHVTGPLTEEQDRFARCREAVQRSRRVTDVWTPVEDPAAEVAVVEA